MVLMREYPENYKNYTYQEREAYCTGYDKGFRMAKNVVQERTDRFAEDRNLFPNYPVKPWTLEAKRAKGTRVTYSDQTHPYVD
jgi:hypothetical protein